MAVFICLSYTPEQCKVSYAYYIQHIINVIDFRGAQGHWAAPSEKINVNMLALAL